MFIRHIFVPRAIVIAILLSISVVVAAQDATSETATVPTCTLADQIRTQNTGRQVGDCELSGNGWAFTFHEDIVLTEPLPAITTSIQINGNGFSINGKRKFRLFEVDGAHLTIENLQMVDGFAKFFGSAILVENGGHLELRNSSIRNCWAGYKGAISIDFGTLSVYNTEFESNLAEDGAAIYSFYSNSYIRNSRFERNWASRGGAVFHSSGEGIIRNSEFSRNIGRDSGGAIHSWHGSLQIRESKFSDNSAPYGGAIYVTGQDHLLSVDHSTLHENSSVNLGGAIYANGGKVFVSDSFIRSNFAYRLGAGLHIKDAELFLSFSELDHNEAKEGAAIYADGGSVTILDTVVSNNLSTENGEQLSLEESEVRHLDIRDS